MLRTFFWYHADPKWNIAKLASLDNRFDSADKISFIKSSEIFPVQFQNPEDRYIYEKRFILLMLAIKWLNTES